MAPSIGTRPSTRSQSAKVLASPLKRTPPKKEKKTTARTRKNAQTPVVSESDEQSSSGISSASPETVDEPSIGPLVGREKEFHEIRNVIESSMNNGTPASLYVSGAPGTGKTATITRVLSSLGTRIRFAIVNCVSNKTWSDICAAVLQNIQAAPFKKSKRTSYPSLFSSELARRPSPIVIVLDEMDFITEKGTVERLFMLPIELSHRIIILAIANTMDLTLRVHPQLELLEPPPKRMTFQRYTKQQITDILSSTPSRLCSLSLSLCAAKVANETGDLRTAFDLMRQANSRIERVEEEERHTNQENQPPGGTSTPVVANSARNMKLIADIYKNGNATPLARAKLPHQSTILLAVILKMSQLKKALTRSGLFTTYPKVCRSVGWPAVSGSDLNEAFELLDSQSFLKVDKKGLIRLQVDADTAYSVIRLSDATGSIITDIDHVNVF